VSLRTDTQADTQTDGFRLAILLAQPAQQKKLMSSTNLKKVREFVKSRSVTVLMMTRTAREGILDKV